MSKYLAIMSKKLMSNLIYRLATVLNMLAMSTYFLASYYFWQALIAGGARPDANIRDLMFYSLLSEIVIELCYSNIAGMLEGEIQDGSVAMHFIRPISFRLECFSLSFGENLYWTSVFVLPAFVTCALLVGSARPGERGARLMLRGLAAAGGLVYRPAAETKVPGVLQNGHLHAQPDHGLGFCHAVLRPVLG